MHLIKLSVGTESVDDLEAWHISRRAQYADGLPRHVTRMWPKKEAALLSGGSIFWVIKGTVSCRQKIIRLDEVIGDDGIRRCAIVLDPVLYRTHSQPRRAFQGWRYLKPEDAPDDLPQGRASEPALPAALAHALAEIGVR